MSSVVVTELTRSFAGVAVLRGIDLEVPTGAVTCILGPSGCGKTTLLRLIAGFDTPDAGTIAIDGKVVVGAGRLVPPERRHVGFVPQEGALFPHLTVSGNLAFGLTGHNRGSASLIANLLDLVGLDEPYARRYPHQLSGGQQQRVALARALAAKPDVVLLDEPFSSLDAAMRESTRRAVMQALERTGTTAMLVTHDQAEALSVGHRVAVMLDGRVIQVDAPANLYRAPADARVARFLGEANVLPATVRDDLAHCALGSVPLRAGTPPGQADVMIRPEQIELTRPDVPGTASATVIASTFYGPNAMIQLQIEGSAVPVSARVPGYVPVEVGQTVGLLVRGESVAYLQSA